MSACAAVAVHRHGATRAFARPKSCTYSVDFQPCTRTHFACSHSTRSSPSSNSRSAGKGEAAITLDGEGNHCTVRLHEYTRSCRCPPSRIVLLFRPRPQAGHEQKRRGARRAVLMVLRAGACKFCKKAKRVKDCVDWSTSQYSRVVPLQRTVRFAGKTVWQRKLLRLRHNRAHTQTTWKVW